VERTSWRAGPGVDVIKLFTPVLDLIKLFCINLLSLFCTLDLFVAIQQILLMSKKRSNLEKVGVNLRHKSFMKCDCSEM
jgi:hypothetical protein